MKNEIYGLSCSCPQCDPHEVRYVGKTSKGAHERLKTHKTVSRGSTAHLPVSMWIRKHGEDNIQTQVLQSASTEGELSGMEEQWIIKLGTLKGLRGLNLTSGGEGVSGYVFSDEVKARFRERTKDQFERKHPRKKLSDQDAHMIRTRLWDGEYPETVREDYPGTSMAVILKLEQESYRPSIPFPNRPRTVRASRAPQKSEEVKSRFAKGELRSTIRGLYFEDGYSKSEIARKLDVSNAMVTVYTKP